ncbi:superoxide dismutase [Mycoplasmatota bacterium zrk1]
MKYEVKPLGYSYSEFEPLISEETIITHYDKLYRGYVASLNKVVSSINYDISANELLMSIQDYPIKRNDIIRYAGGVSNHELYFDSLTNKKTYPSKFLLDAIECSFGSFNQMIDYIITVSKSVFGSGYVFLVMEGEGLAVIKTINQNSPLIYGFYPLLAIDLWEHSYFLDYANRRDEYVKSVIKLLNWDNANDLFIRYKRKIRNGIL